MAKRKTLTAGDIGQLLAARHVGDVWVAECKNGRSWGEAFRVLDGWAMKKSWSPWTTVGYEVKVSRSDFERDQKWPEYLPLCHEFYFVCPGGLIKATDLPPGVGLLWAGQNGERLHTKVKAKRREPDTGKLLSLIAYVLMSRTRIVADMHEAARAEPGDRLAQMRAWAEGASQRKELAWFVHEHIRHVYAEQEKRLAEMGRKVAQAEQLRKHLAELGVEWEPGGWRGPWEAMRQIDVLLGRLPPGFERLARDASEKLAAVVKTIDELRAPPAPPAAEEMEAGR